MEDYFQTDVDDFDSGSFLFLSAKEVDIIVDDKLMEDIGEVDKKGIIVSTYCYTYSRYMKFLIINYKAKPWHNNYTIKRGFTRTMNIDDMAFQGTKDDYIEWMKIVEVPTSSQIEKQMCGVGEKNRN
jgi:hypothetical protein